MENKQPKTFEEIDAKLQEDLRQISGEIEEIENHLQVGQEMLEKQASANATEEVLEKYKKGLEELQKGLEMFLGIKDEIQQTIVKLHQTKAQADEHIK
jgi:chromosome segregation ATPase